LLLFLAFSVLLKKHCLAPKRDKSFTAINLEAFALGLLYPNYTAITLLIIVNSIFDATLFFENFSAFF
jgi:hypothetical protein